MMLTQIFRRYSTSYLLLSIAGAPLIAAQDDKLAKFGDTIEVLGQMARTDQDFVDGLALDLFSPTNRTLVVTNNTAPLPGNFVTGSSGEGFISLSTYSWIIKFNETAQDLIAKIELPYDPSALKGQSVDVSNTYVGTLAKDKKSWIVSETQRNVHVYDTSKMRDISSLSKADILIASASTENKTRIIKMTSLDGEYMLLGRKSEDVTNIFVQYGQGATRTVNVTGGNNFQEAEFVDGLRLRVQSAKPFTLNADISNGVDEATIPENSISLNSFAWVINTTIPSGNSKAVDMRVPFNRDMLAAKAAGKSHKQLVVAHRALQARATDPFQILEKQEIEQSESRIKVSGLSSIDGQYIVLVTAEEERGEGDERGDGKHKGYATNTVDVTGVASLYPSGTAQYRNVTQGINTEQSTIGVTGILNPAPTSTEAVRPSVPVVMSSGKKLKASFLTLAGAVVMAVVLLPH